MIRRWLDIFLSLVGIVLFLPFFPIVALFIKLDSRGPIFYLGDRVGKHAKLFKMYKFRTMVDSPVRLSSVCPQYDPRVTAFGKFLRRTKINEIPQFINVLKGDMTFVGPRPETPDLAELYPEHSQRIFSVKPGLVGPNQILGRNEEEMYPPGVDPKQYYIEKILPGKVAIDLEYIDNPSMFKDLIYIIGAAKETLLGSLNKKYIQRNRSQLLLLLADIHLTLLAYVFACGIERHDIFGRAGIVPVLISTAMVVLLRTGCFFCFGFYNSLIRYISYRNVIRIVYGVTSSSLILMAVSFMLGVPLYSKRVAMIDWACLIGLLATLRFSLRFYWEMRHPHSKHLVTHKVLIYGAGDTGELACRTLMAYKNSPFEVVGFIDDAEQKYGKTLHGLRVLGNRYHLSALSQLYQVKEVILALGNTRATEVSKIIEICQQAGIRYRVFSSIHELEIHNRFSFPVRTVEISDLLPIKRITMDHSSVAPLVEGKTVLVNGSGGALGLELCRQLLQLRCKQLVILDRYESYLTELTADLVSTTSKDMIIPILITNTHSDTMKEILNEYRPSVVFHTAMKKYTPLFDVSTREVAPITYEDTFNFAKRCADIECETFVVISSLAAGNGEGFISQSLREAEISLQNFFQHTSTRLVIARVCNIVENRGGIISVLESQIRRQQTVTLASPEVKVHLLSKYSAAQFILQALAEAKRIGFPRGTFVCEAGSPISLLEVAQKIAILHGFKLGVDLPIKYIDLSERRHPCTQPADCIPLDTHNVGLKFLKEVYS